MTGNHFLVDGESLVGHLFGDYVLMVIIRVMFHAGFMTFDC